ncbi:NUDIX domain-containing protein [Aerosakkonemataceae cyanobacterium BLCC-F154]|uniref:NUDIX domain-containing protein n=2 Tax=Floridanema TaxID=3396149 RepID=A0ABV4YM29_9CYAN
MPKLTTLIYCVENGKVLLAQRIKEPFIGYWIAPGGKLEPGESPYQCAVRELIEETGLSAHNPRLRGIVTETSALPDWQWMIFIYVVTSFSGTLISDRREGKLNWWSLANPGELYMPEADRIFLPKVLDFNQPIYQATFYYDDNLVINKISEHPAWNSEI